MTAVLLLALGLGMGTVLGALGSLTGIGGGFLLMPALLWALPGAPPGALSVASLTVVLFNSLSGTVLSVRRERLRWPTGLAYGAASLIPVWLGVQLQAQVDRAAFSAAFGGLLLAGAVLLVWKPAPKEAPQPGPGRWVLGLAASAAIGLVSGFFGVGGGFLFVPLLAFFLRLPLAEATATSQFMVGLGAALALTVNAGAFALPLSPSLLAGLVAGVLVGAPLGVEAAGRLPDRVVLRVLAALLVLAAAKFLWPVNI